MKTLHLIDHDGLGGAQSVVYQSTHENSDIYIYALKHKQIRKSGKNHIIPTKKKNIFQQLIYINKIIVENKITIIHAHLKGSYIISWLLKKLFQRNIKLIFHEHGLILAPPNWYLKFLQMTSRSVDAYIACSNSINSKLSDLNQEISLKTQTIYNFYYPMSIRKNEDKKNTFTVGFSGRIIEFKGWKTIINSAKLLKKTNTPISFLIAGDGPEANDLIQQIKKHNLQESVKFIGHQDSMKRFYSLVDCVVMASSREASPLTFYEAQGLGKPIIGTDVIAINELIKNQHNGLLFEYNNHSQLADLIVQLYDSRALRQKLKISGLKIIKKYSLIKYQQLVDSLYEQIST